MYDPDRLDFTGWMRSEDRLESISKGEGSANEQPTDWISPLLGIRFKLEPDGLIIYRPEGQTFSSFIDLDLRRQEAEQRAERLATKLRELGIDPENL